MVQRPNLEVLDEGPPLDLARAPRAERLLQEIAATLQMPPDIAELVAFTHALATLQAHSPFHLRLISEPGGDHNLGLGHG